MSTSVTLTITKNDNGTTSTHLTGYLDGSQQTMEAVIPRPLLPMLTKAVVTVWAIIKTAMDHNAATAVERN